MILAVHMDACSNALLFSSLAILHLRLAAPLMHAQHSISKGELLECVMHCQPCKCV